MAVNDRDSVDGRAPGTTAVPQLPTADAEPLEWVGTPRLRALLRERCGRLMAPPALRQRILASLPHRRSPGIECG